MTLIYGYFGEDEALKLFLEHYLTKATTKLTVRFQAHPFYSRKFQGLNNKGVDKGFRNAWLAGFAQKEYKLNCLFVGRDLDADTTTIRAERLRHFNEQVRDIDRPDWLMQTIFVLPMQCIEHWLLALLRRLNGRLDKDCRGLERIVNDAVKRELYDEHPRLPVEHSKMELVATIAATLEIEWLAAMSESFRHFHQDVLTFISSQRES